MFSCFVGCLFYCLLVFVLFFFVGFCFILWVFVFLLFFLLFSVYVLGGVLCFCVVVYKVYRKVYI